MTETKGMAPTGILHFAIGVSDLKEARKFYEGVLGCTYLRENDTTVFMKAGDDHFVLTNTSRLGENSGLWPLPILRGLSQDYFNKLPSC